MDRIAANLLNGKTVYVTADEQGNLKPAAKVYAGTPTATVTDVLPAKTGKGLLIVTDKGSFQVATAKKTLYVQDVEPTNLSEISDADEATAQENQDCSDADAAAAEAAIIAEAEVERAEEPATDEPATVEPPAPTEKATDAPAAPKRIRVKTAPAAPTADMHPLTQHILGRMAELHTLDIVSGKDRQRFTIKNLQVEVEALMTAAKLTLTTEEMAPLMGA